MPFASSSIRARARRRVAQRVRAGEGCVFCGRPIELSIKYPDPMAFVVDHSIPTSLGGTDIIENYRPAHNSCNRQRGNLPDGTVGTNSGALDPWAPTPWGYPGAAARRHRRTSGAPIPRGAGGGRSV